ncbi:SAM-dependent methyltransferase [Synechococcus sp. M16CYN]|uniref:class I SAM-dependent methyltransferase n=1 Tax=Synechococcus sp. M16CYN TaxID=3103139 RepID=UPI0032460688
MEPTSAVCPTWLAMHLKQAGGVIPFRQFMHLALNDPNHGFYGAGRALIAPNGDFVTSPSLGSDFAALLAAQVMRWLQAFPVEIPKLSLVEIGPGEGDLLADLIDALIDQAPHTLHRLELVLVETNPGMQKRQRSRLSNQVAVPIRWCSLDNLMACPVQGIVLAHELLDTLPVERLSFHEGMMWQQLVALNANDFLTWSRRPVPPPLAEEVARVCRRCKIALPPRSAKPGWTTEWHCESPRWFGQVSRAIRKGILLVVDYALEARRYYSACRYNGTLMATRAQQAGLSPLQCPGFQDLTAHICIDIVQDAAIRSGWTPLGQMRQGEALLALGLAERLHKLQSLPATQLPEILRRREALLRLVDPSGLGDFRWLLYGKGLQLDRFKLTTAPDSEEFPRE